MQHVLVISSICLQLIDWVFKNSNFCLKGKFNSIDALLFKYVLKFFADSHYYKQVFITISVPRSHCTLGEFCLFKNLLQVPKMVNKYSTMQCFNDDAVTNLYSLQGLTLFTWHQEEHLTRKKNCVMRCWLEKGTNDWHTVKPMPSPLHHHVLHENSERLIYNSDTSLRNCPGKQVVKWL